MELPIVQFLNDIVPQLIAWCTPSVLLDAPRVSDVYVSDMSVSYTGHGDPSKAPWDPKAGVFGRACNLAARAYHADLPGDPGFSLFSVNGASGANFMVIKALQRQLGGRLHVLAERNAHRSIIEACEDYRAAITFVEPTYHPDYQFFIPSPPPVLANALQADPSINVVLLVNPTYEGFSRDTEEVIRALRQVREDVVVFADAAWGSNFQFSPEQPKTAMESGADVAVLSLHKQGGSLQQTAIILWKERRIDRHVMFNAYRSLVTTSPSWHLLASIDSARAYMEEHGAAAIGREIEIAAFLEGQLRDLLVRVTDADVRKIAPASVVGMDKTKVLFHLHQVGLSGIHLANELTRRKIVVEWATEDLILLIVPFQRSLEDAQTTVRAVREGVNCLKQSPEHALRRMPRMATVIDKVKEAFEVGATELVALDHAVGRVCAENVVPYPPGTPLVTKGERICAEHVAYVRALKKEGQTIIMQNGDSFLVERNGK